MQKSKKHHLLVILISSLCSISLVLLSGCFMLPGETDVAPPQITTITPSEDILPDPAVPPDGTAEVQEYVFCSHYDEVAEMEAFRTYAPAGWETYGRVSWDLASATAPARSDFLAVSPDGQAGYVRVSDMHYVEHIYSGAYNATDITPPDGTPTRWRATAAELVAEIPAYILDSFGSVQVTGTYNADPEGVVQNLYETTMQPTFTQMESMGVQVSGAFGTLELVTGTAVINGIECDFECYLTMTGYTLTSTGFVTITSNYWSPFVTQFFYAPKGHLSEYLNDIDIILENYVDNQNWINARNAVSAEAFRLLEQRQMQDWARANEFSEALYSSMYYYRGGGSDYSSVWEDRESSSSYYLDRWTETLTGREAWDIGGGEYIVTDNTYDTLWGDGSGNFIGSNDPGFDPGAGYSEYEPLI